MSEFVAVCEADRLSDGERLSLDLDGRAVLLFRIGSEHYAVDDLCSHDGQPLTDGPLQDFSIECPRHGARFDVRTGRPQCMPAVEPIPVHEVKVDAGQIWIAIND